MKEEKELSFEECLARLEAIVREVEAGNLNLDDAIARFAEGMALIKRCRALLTAAEQKICLLLEDEAAGLVTLPVESFDRERNNGL